FGLELGSNGLSHTVIRHNAFVTNNASGVGVNGTAIYGPSHVADAEIDANSMTGHTSFSIALYAAYSSDVSITGNTSSGDGPMDLRHLHGGVVSGNTITGNTGSGISLSGGNTDLAVSGNGVSGSSGSGVSV